MTHINLGVFSFINGFLQSLIVILQIIQKGDAKEIKKMYSFRQYFITHNRAVQGAYRDTVLFSWRSGVKNNFMLFFLVIIAISAHICYN